MFMLWHQIKMEKITTFICAIELTFPLNVFLFYLKIIYTKVKFHPSKSLYKKYFPEDKKQTNLQNWAKFEENIPTLSQVCISSGFRKRRIENFHNIKRFNLSTISSLRRWLGHLTNPWQTREFKSQLFRHLISRGELMTNPIF